MKNLIKYLFVSLLIICLYSCDDEDGFYNEKYVDTTQLVVINQGELHTGDRLYIYAAIDRYLVEPGFSNLLDIYKTTGNSQAFTFSYFIEKQGVDGEWQFVDFTNSSADVVEGSAEVGSYILGHANFIPSENQYLYNVGLPLPTTGEYRLSFGINSDETNVIEFRSESAGNNINLNLISSISGLDSSGYYHFTVLP